jgi:BirA family biotin operon repressor/biotin-[acetyl-CoA-carboxylase] ligase
LILTNLIQTNLTTKIFGRTIEYFTFTDSTNEDAWELLLDGADEGLVVTTDQQKRGRGRRGNVWLSEPGASLTFSLIIKPELNAERLGLLSLLTGVAVVRGISNFAQINCQLKWPNDIVLNGKKVGGILAESKKIDSQMYVVMGVGLNVNEQTLPDELTDIATSLRIKKGNPIQREPLLAFVLNEFEGIYKLSTDQWIEKWNSECCHLEREIKFHSGSEFIKGIFTGIDETGQAMIKIDGVKQKFSTGTIEIT